MLSLWQHLNCSLGLCLFVFCSAWSLLALHKCGTLHNYTSWKDRQIKGKLWRLKMSDFSVESSSTSSASDRLWLIWVFGKTHWSELMCKQVYCMLYLNIPTWIWPVTQHWYSSRQNRRPQTFTKQCRWKLWTIKMYKKGFKWWTRCCRLITKQHRCMYCINNSYESMHWYCCDYVFT